MEKEVAQHLAKSAFKLSSELSQLVPFIKENCPDEKLQKELKLAVATIIANIDLDFNQKIYAIHPSVKHEIEESINKYGVLIHK